jgi:signal transduction histidine kinase
MSMVFAGSSPERPRRDSVLPQLLPPALAAVCGIAAVVVLVAEPSAPAGWYGAVAVAALFGLAAEAVRRGRAVAELREGGDRREAELKRRLNEQEAETVRLAEVLLPEVVARLQQGEWAEEVLHGATLAPGLDPRFTAAHLAVLRSVVEAVKAEEDLRDSARRAFVNIARRVQAIVHQQAQDVREMQDRHGRDPEMFGDLLHLDHGTALVGRLADSIAVLGGARPGRQWHQDVALFSILRGAMSRIIEYQRVDLHSVSQVAVVGSAAEPLIHAVAELLDNAARYSPPQTRVHLTATEVQAGVAIEIEDGGVGLSEQARVRAERVLSLVSADLDLADMGETPRLGLSVVGRLAQANDFRVSLRPSAYGGVRAVVVVPLNLITAIPDQDAATASGGMLRPLLPPVAPVREERLEPIGSSDADGDGNGLPQRRRRGGIPQPRIADAILGPAPTSATATTANHAAPAPAVEPGLWLAAFQNAVSGEPSTTANATGGSPAVGSAAAGTAANTTGADSSVFPARSAGDAPSSKGDLQ